MLRKDIKKEMLLSRLVKRLNKAITLVAAQVLNEVIMPL